MSTIGSATFRSAALGNATPLFRTAPFGNATPLVEAAIKKAVASNTVEQLFEEVEALGFDLYLRKAEKEQAAKEQAAEAEEAAVAAMAAEVEKFAKHWLQETA